MRRKLSQRYWLDDSLVVSDANPTVGGDGVFALWAYKNKFLTPKGQMHHQGLSTERRSIRRKQTFCAICAF